MRAFVVLSMLLLLVASASAAETARVVILHVNDSHGRTLGESSDGKVHGGYARLSTVVGEIRKKESHVILLHAGDEMSRGDLLTSSSAGAANIGLMNALRFDAWTLGNGEYYLGPSTVQKRIAEATFPTLASNVTYRLKGEPMAQDTVILKTGEIRLGLLGMCFVRMAHPSALPLVVADPLARAKKLVPELQKQADVVIALDHIGLEQDRRLAAAVDGIDLIVGGHSHTTLPQGTRVTSPSGRPVVIAQAGEYLRYVGRVDLELARDGGKWRPTAIRCSLIPLDGAVPEDPTIKARIARFWPATAPAVRPAAATAQ